MAYGKKGATIEEIKIAIKLANDATFIDMMPQVFRFLVHLHRGHYGFSLAQLRGGMCYAGA